MNDVDHCLSSNSIVIPAASTGSDTISRIEVNANDHTSSGVCSDNPPDVMIVVRKLIEDPIEAAPDRCNAKIASSTATELCTKLPDNGGYTVQPTPGPSSVSAALTRSMNDNGINQNDSRFNLGKNISLAPTRIGISILPTPPIASGIMKKKIISNP